VLFLDPVVAYTLFVNAWQVVDVGCGQHGKSDFPAQNMWLVLHVYGQFLTGAEMIHAVIVQAVYNVLSGLSSGRTVTEVSLKGKVASASSRTMAKKAQLGVNFRIQEFQKKRWWWVQESCNLAMVCWLVWMVCSL